MVSFRAVPTRYRNLWRILPEYGNRTKRTVFLYQRRWRTRDDRTYLHSIDHQRRMDEFKPEPATVKVLSGQLKTEKPPPEEERSELFPRWFSRCRGALQIMASLILGGSEMADEAVLNCWIKASRSPPGFESEGPFRDWIMRILISESLSILRRSLTEASERNVSARSKTKNENRRMRE
jgi:hypothetical protein